MHSEFTTIIKTVQEAIAACLKLGKSTQTQSSWKSQLVRNFVGRIPSG
jgi:hypothetical protein